MRAMILAAGEGRRMQPLTDDYPKALLEVHGKPLIVYQIESLARAGIKELVINHGRLGELIEKRLGNGEKYNVSIQYSAEGNSPLETAGGIKYALPLLGSEPFIAVNADVWTDYDFTLLPRYLNNLAHLIVVDNPEHHRQGDFNLHQGQLTTDTGTRYTFSGVGVYSPDLFSTCPDAAYPLAPLLVEAIAKGQVTADHYSGTWLDIGTPERLAALEASFK